MKEESEKVETKVFFFKWNKRVLFLKTFRPLHRWNKRKREREIAVTDSFFSKRVWQHGRDMYGYYEFIYKSVSDLIVTIIPPEDMNFVGRTTFIVRFLYCLFCTHQKLFPLFTMFSPLFPFRSVLTFLSQHLSIRLYVCPYVQMSITIYKKKKLVQNKILWNLTQ